MLIERLLNLKKNLLQKPKTQFFLFFLSKIFGIINASILSAINLVLWAA